MCEEHLGRYTGKILSARLERLEIAILLFRAHLHKRGLREFLVDCTQRGSEQFRRREGELVALTRCSGLPRTVAVKSLASTPRTRELLIDEIWDASLKRAGPLVVFGDQTCYCGLDEGGLVIVEKQIGSCQPVGAKAWSGGLSDRRRSGRGLSGSSFVFLMFPRRRVIERKTSWEHRSTDHARRFDHCPSRDVRHDHPLRRHRSKLRPRYFMAPCR